MKHALTLLLVSLLVGCHESNASGQSASQPASAAASAPSLPGQLTVVTYNVLADPVAESKRVPALLKILAESDADIIALEECTSWFLNRLAREDWAKPYHMLRVEGQPASFDGQFIMSRFPIEKADRVRQPGRQGREALVARLRLPGRSLAVGVVHLESPLADGPTRAKQLDAIWPLLKDADDAMLVGDFNFGDGEQPDTAHLDGKFVDLWKALKPSDAGYTWNIEASDMARKGSFPGEKSRRLDRILLRSKLWRPAEAGILGDQPLKAGDKSLFPSDHFGLVGKITSAPAAATRP